MQLNKTQHQVEDFITQLEVYLGFAEDIGHSIQIS